VDSITPARLKDHFIATEDGYHVRTHINRMIVWAEHNLIDHPPFSGLSLISCRNVLIYFQPKLQERIRALFQFALRAEGILFLGTSEAIPDVSGIFTVVDSKQKIYRRSAGAARQWMRLDQPLFARLPAHLEDRMSISQTSQTSGDDHKLNIIKSMLLTHYNSTCAIVDEHYYVRYTYGEIDRYLRLVPGGEVQTSILSMAREGLNSDLTIALYESYESENTITRSGVWMQSNGAEYAVNLIVKPIQDSIIGSRFKLVIFEPTVLAVLSADSETATSTDQGEGATIKRLRDELQQSRQALQSATQALQAKSEELSSSMEEISSANEEVQTTNEELRTSKEELESMNEELNTLNSQLTSQNLELTHANNTLYNFLQSTEIGVIFLDQNLAIREYTQAATAIFSLRKNDIGRPLAEITSQLVYDALIEDAAQVLDTLVTSEREVATQNWRWYKAEIRPYRTMNNAIDGLVLTFTDVTLQKQAQQEAERTTDYMRQVVDTVENSLLEMDGMLTVLTANEAFYQQFQVTEAETVGRMLYDLGNVQWDIPDLRRLLNEVIPQQTFVRDYTVTHDFPGIGRRTMRLNARRVKDVDRIVLVITDMGAD
jgi:two-component system CheB/CheR fusion protein